MNPEEPLFARPDEPTNRRTVSFFAVSGLLTLALVTCALQPQLQPTSLWNAVLQRAPSVVSFRRALLTPTLPRVSAEEAERPAGESSSTFASNLYHNSRDTLPVLKVSVGSQVLEAEPQGVSRIPIVGPLLGFLASVCTLYSYSAFRKRHQANLQDAARWEADHATAQFVGIDVVPGLSGLNGKALISGKKYPSKPEVMAKIPKELMKKDTFKSMMYMLTSVSLTALCVYAGTFIPYSMSYAGLWLLYGLVTGTVATGCWVIGHECGHNAFSDNKTLQDTVGYIIHSTLLVPYFAWQRSHAVHHANTNHMEVGETHVPRLATETDARLYAVLSKILGPLWPVAHSLVVLLAGWPIYLMRGASGGPAYGTTNHFWPYAPFNNGTKELFPGQHKMRVLLSGVGVFFVLAALVTWGRVYGAMYPLLHYVLPYFGVNAWLVGYTWLQHTDVDVPHFDQNEYTWAKGAFHTIDRPYGPVFDFLHHGIGSTHVAHHVNSAIPHYNAWEVTDRLKQAFPDLYLYDPTPIHRALFRIAKNCVGVAKQPGPDGMYVWVKDPLRVKNAIHPAELPAEGQPALVTV